MINVKFLFNKKVCPLIEMPFQMATVTFGLVHEIVLIVCMLSRKSPANVAGMLKAFMMII